MATSPLIKKSPAMHIAVLAAWAMCVAFYVPSIYGLFHRSGFLYAPLSAAIVWLLLGFLCLFWLYGSFFFFQFVAAFVQKRSAPLQPPPVTSRWPRVAILYTTFHDFQEQAVESCIRQQYPGEFKVFILDDSVRPEFKDRIDKFAANYSEDLVRVVRRPQQNRTGYKAGNLNYALRNEVTNFPYFAVFDADSIVPPDFLTKLMPYFEMDPSIAFLQGSHRPMPHQQTAFARDLCLWTDAVWSFMWLPKNLFGAVFFLGHGGILSYPKWKEVENGFPELVAEDIAISARLQVLGYRGWHIHEAYSYEEFPDDYLAFRKQQKKYMEGACQFMLKEYPRYFRSPHPSWFEKFDLFLTCTSQFSPLVMSAFCILFCIVTPWRFGLWQPVQYEIAEGMFVNFELLLQRYFREIWTWPYLQTMVACSFGPALGALATVPRASGAGMRKGLNLVFLSAVPFMSLFIMGAVAILTYLISGKAVFGVTGDKTVKADDSFVCAVEELFIILCGTACILTGNLTLLAPCLAVLIGLMLRWDTSGKLWESWMRPILYIPFICILAGVAILTALTAGR